MGTKHPSPDRAIQRRPDVLTALRLTLLLLYVAVPLVAVYVVVRLAVRHELAADRRRVEPRPGPDDPVSSQVKGRAQ
jgi:hypothetical protein